MERHHTASKPTRRSPARLPIVLLFAVLLCLDLSACRIAYWSMGNGMTGFLLIVVLLFMVPLFAASWRFPNATSLVALCLSALLVLPQALAGYRWLHASRVAAVMAVEACQARTLTGDYPASLPKGSQRRASAYGPNVNYGLYGGRVPLIYFSLSWPSVGHKLFLGQETASWWYESD